MKYKKKKNAQVLIGSRATRQPHRQEDPIETAEPSGSPIERRTL